MADVFLSYARQERNEVIPIKALLEKLGLSVFIDVEGLDGGDHFPQRLEQEIRASRLVVGCWSPVALSRPWVIRECMMAMQAGIILPIQIKPFDDTNMVVSLSTLHYIDLTDFLSESSLEKRRNFVGVISRKLVDPDIVARFEKLNETPSSASAAPSRDAGLDVRTRELRSVFDELKTLGNVEALEQLLAQVKQFAAGTGLDIIIALEIDRIRLARATKPESDSSTAPILPPPAPVASARSFTKILATNAPVARSVITNGLRRARSVGKLMVERNGETQGVATVFAVEGHVLFERWGAQPVLVTCNHVVGSNRSFGARSPSEAFAQFTDDNDAPIDVRFSGTMFESEVERHDVTILRPFSWVSEQIPLISSWSSAPLPVRSDTDDGIGRVYVIGFPLGGSLSFSFADNILIDHDEDVVRAGEPVHLHYRAPTLSGSSGSPVFDAANFELIGMHHSGANDMRRLPPRRGTYPANEGISIRSIRQAIAMQLG